uniref:PDZ domain-containing protein n=1 Tax=Alexandrium andersonii TaxID=327968 RepID=A0A7S2II66_9DINO|mmetsp:Transcript_83935/g.187377  ORF Transcript_83935/g.187377 Transcript_83935/m.187377 type:complete len:141 (+) Transcript_83935:130-552(+)
MDSWVTCCSCQREELKANDSIAEAIDVVPLPSSFGKVKIEKSQSTMNFHIEKVVQITRSGPHWRTIGMVISPSLTEETLLVNEVVVPSLIGDWNETEADVFGKVGKGDKIVAVNSARTVDQMLRVIQASGRGSVLKFRME